MINPADYPEVEAAFLNLVRDERAWNSQQRNLVNMYDGQLRELSDILLDDSVSANEKIYLFTKIQAIQTERSKALASISDTKTLESADAQRARLKKDFEKICKSTRIIDTSVQISQNVSFIIHATCFYEGQEYFIGDFKVVFGYMQTETPYTLSGVKTGVYSTRIKGSYPDYRYRGEGQGFCVGSNRTTLKTLFANRQYVQAVQLLTFVLCSINEGDEEKIPKTFRLEKLGGVSWPLSAVNTTLSTS